MKFIWQDDDIQVGRVTIHKGEGERWMIGYAAETREPRYQLVSLRDGMIQPRITRSEMARHLNDAEHHPLALQPIMVESLLK